MPKTSLDARFWNLAQASAWVRFRTRKQVDEFALPSADQWASINFYSTMERVPEPGSVTDLLAALRDGRLCAWGRPAGTGGPMQVIPAIEWSDLHIRPPAAVRRHPAGGEFEPWTDIRFESKDLKKLWRSVPEVQSRSRFDWQAIAPIWREVCVRFPDASSNERIVELQGLFRDQFNKEPPSRAAIQPYIKRWR